MVLALKYWRRLSSLSVATLYFGQRRYFDSKKDVLDLPYQRTERITPTTPSGSPLVICHGLYGPEDNWPKLRNQFSMRLDADVYSLDMINQGYSSRAARIDYTRMAEDVISFCQKHNLKRISLFGHSIGSKVAMAMALHPDLPRELLSHVIVEDIPPTRDKFFPEVRYYVEMMQTIIKAKASTIEEIDRLLEALEPDLAFRAFIRTNMVLMAAERDSLRARISPDVLNHALDNICGFPFEPTESKWFGKVLLIKGYQSKYVLRRDHFRMKDFFPRMKVETLDANHWIHTEKPGQLIEVVVHFIKNQKLNPLRLVNS